MHKLYFMRIETFLEMTEQHLAECDLRVSRQRDLVSHLVAIGEDNAAAIGLLTIFEELLACKAANLKLAYQMAV